jgi:hypothetical protein
LVIAAEDYGDRKRLDSLTFFFPDLVMSALRLFIHSQFSIAPGAFRSTPQDIELGRMQGMRNQGTVATANWQREVSIRLVLERSETLEIAA